MTGIDVVNAALGSSQFIFNTYLSDLSDTDLRVRPAPTANHIAWQLGHIISSERAMVLQQLPNAAMPALPAGFAEAHTAATTTKDDGFLTKAEYTQLFASVRAATMATVSALTEADLDTPTKGSMAPFAPKLGDYFLLISNHTLMHAGQFVVVRRLQGKPVLI